MAKRIAIDPVTRIEGHLRVELDAGDDNQVTAAYASGTMVRGLETILRGRDPRSAWAIAQRACGVCTLVHGLASVRAVEDALGTNVPPAAVAIRNLMLAQQFVHDHVMHFYHLHALDWANARHALEADPSETAGLQARLSPWPSNSADWFDAVRSRLRGILDSDRPSVFAAGSWDHPAYRLPAALDLLVMAHYFEALDWQAGATVIHNVLGGRNPHPNLVVGGVPLPIDMAEGAALNRRRLNLVRDSLKSLTAFVEQVYWPDLRAILKHYTDYAYSGEGIGNLLCWGEFPSPTAPAELAIPRGVLVGRDAGAVMLPDPADGERLKEFVARSWYTHRGGAGVGLHPWAGETAMAYSGPGAPYDLLDVDGAYSWLKAPRWDGKPMEVGPLARVMVMLAAEGGSGPVSSLVDPALEQLGLARERMYSTLGRTLARGVETVFVVQAMAGMLDGLEALIAQGRTETFDGARWEPETWPRRCRGVGLLEAPRGALRHWVVIESDRIANYQMVVPTTWNASPRDAAGLPGPYEAALAGLRLERRYEPLEALRVLHSFDPCMACAVH